MCCTIILRSWRQSVYLSRSLGSATTAHVIAFDRPRASASHSQHHHHRRRRRRRRHHYYSLCLFSQVCSNHFASALSKYFTSSMFPGGPPAQCPHIEGKTSNFPTPGFIFATSYSESSGLYARHALIGCYHWVSTHLPPIW